MRHGDRNMSFGKANLWPLKIYNWASKPCCSIKLFGKLHQAQKGSRQILICFHFSIFSVRCRRISFTCRQGDEECLNAPLSLSYNFLSFPTNVKVPTDLFSMSGPQTAEKYFDWSLNVTSVYPAHSGITPVNRNYFDLKINRNEAVVALQDRIKGAQDIELLLSMKITDRYTGYTGNALSRIYLYVTSQNIRTY